MTHETGELGIRPIDLTSRRRDQHTKKIINTDDLIWIIEKIKNYSKLVKWFQRRYQLSNIFEPVQ